MDNAASKSQYANGSLVPSSAAFSLSWPVKAALIAALCLAFALVIFFVAASNTPLSKPSQALSALGGDFVLQSYRDGEVVDVALSDFRGKSVVLYFGFLSCPQVCPASMGMVAAAFAKLPDDHLAKTQALLISFDPKRDRPKNLAEYARFYHPNWLGLTGSEGDIAAVARQYRTYYAAKAIEDSEIDYVYDHSSRYYIIDGSGQLVDVMRHGTTANELAARLKLLAEPT